MNINPKTQTRLYGLTFYLNSLIKLFDSNRLSNKILLTGLKGIGKSTLAYHFINYVFSKDEEYSYNKSDNVINKENRSYKLIINKSHPNFYHIDLMDEKKNIEISQIRQMFNYANKSSFNNKPRFVFIDNWYVPYERHCSHDEVYKILNSLILFMNKTIVKFGKNP